ncbi:MAG: hypothetical protein KAT10_00400 [Sulfurimonas sp.]|nr:hypothetical protein [Sulfurimonas sp.]
MSGVIVNVLWRVFVGGVLLTWLAGCATNTGIKIDQETLSGIHPGKSTKKELFDLLGPPRAIAVQGRPLYIFQPLHKSDTALSASRANIDKPLQLQAEPFFEVFTPQNTLTYVHRVYFYYYAESRMYMLPFYEKTSLEIDQLLVLVNEESEIVEDVYFMPHPK